MPSRDSTLLPVKQQQRLKTRQRILDAAIEEFRRVGVAAASIGAIAQAAGVSRPTFYKNFPTKEDVLVEYQIQVSRIAAEAIQSAVSDSADTRAFTKRYVDAAFDVVASADPTIRRELFRSIINSPPPLDRVHQPLFGLLVDHFKSAKRRGEIRDDVNPRLVAIVFLQTLGGFLTFESQSLAARRKAAHYAMTLLQNGLEG